MQMSFTILHYACGIKATKLVHVLVHDFKASTRARNDASEVSLSLSSETVDIVFPFSVDNHRLENRRKK